MSTKTYAYLENEVIIWARNRGIPQNSTPVAQARKTLEEAGELLEAAAGMNCWKPGDEERKLYEAMYRDALADVLITLIIGAETTGLDLIDCLNEGYMEIKNRTGRLGKDGVFVKD